MSGTASVTPEPLPPAVEAPARPSLKARILRAGSWSLLGHLGSQSIRLATSLIMTRLLVPEAFGLMAMTAAINMVVSLLTDIGIRQSIVQSARGDQPLMLNTAWTMQVARGFIVWTSCVLVALALHGAASLGWLAAGSVYSAPELPLVLAAATFSAALAGFESTKLFTADRRLELKRVTLIEILSLLAGLVVMAGIGWQTRSVWAFVIGGWVTTLLTVLLSHGWLHGHANRFEWDGDCAREIIRFGRWILISSLLWVLAANGDRLLVGAWASPTVLGYYAIAASLATMVESASGRVFGAVATPAFSDVVRNNPERMREVYLRMRVPFDIAFMGAAGFLFATGQAIVSFLYDARYAEAGHILQVLSFGLLFARYGIAASAYLALGVPQNLTSIHLAKVVSLFVCVPLGHAAYGLEGAFWAVALHLAPTLPIVFWFNAKYRLNSWRHELLSLLVWPVGYALGLGILKVVSWLR